MALTEFELHQLATIPAGSCELVMNEAHFNRVVRYGMGRAKVSLDIMTADFKAMLVPVGARMKNSRRAESIVHLFRRLAERGVEIRIMHAGTPSGPALQELKRALAGDEAAADNSATGKRRKMAAAKSASHYLTMRRCPRLHAKAVIIDARAMYLGSANLTGAGLGAKSPHKRNFEIGVWTEASPLIESVSEQFNLLWEGHRCKTCLRKDVCPVPLEEPRL